MQVTTATRKQIGAFSARLTAVNVQDAAVALWQVEDLESHVDRAALLAADDPAEPPYWAHLWSGATVLAAAVPHDAGRVVEIGCGLGLPGLTAAQRGATSVAFVDRESTPLAFVRESLRANRLGDAMCLVADFTRPPFRGPFDVVLGAEIVYDRAGFGALADALAALAGPAGRVLLADGRRIDTREFYPALERAGFAWSSRSVGVYEDGIATEIVLVDARRR
jgi:predicted nicotinamide N-methyase